MAYKYSFSDVPVLSPMNGIGLVCIEENSGTSHQRGEYLLHQYFAL